MSYTLRHNGREFVVPVEHEQPPSGIYCNIEMAVDYQPPIITDVGLNLLNWKWKLVDAGGQGECFINAFNYLYDNIFSYGVLNKESWYEYFNLPLGEYLEDNHVYLIAKYYGISVCVLREFEGNLYPAVFGGDLSRPWLYIYNEYPSHYYAIVIDPSDSQGESDGDSDNDDQEDEETEEEEEKNNSEEEFDIEETHEEFLNPILSRNPTFNQIVSFMVNSEKFQFTQAHTVLDSFKVLHNEIVLIIDSLNQNRKIPHSKFFKLYYKFRHNVFGFLCLNSIKQERNFGTDVPLSKYIESKRTPDYIIEGEENIDIIEFTVSNNYSTADFNKGGGNQELKYTQEAQKIQEKTGKITKIHMISGILCENNFDEVLTQLKNLGGDPSKQEFMEFYSICNTNRSYINQSQLRCENTVHLSTLDTDLTEYERPALASTLMIPPEMLSNVLRGIERFKNDTVGILRKGRNKFVTVNFDLTLNSIYLQYDRKHRKKSFPSDVFLENLRTNGIEFILQNVKLLREGKNVSSSELRGTVPVTLSNVIARKFEKLPEVTLIGSQNLYSSKVWDDSEYEILKTEGYYDLGDSQGVFFPPNYFSSLCQEGFDNILTSKSTKILANCNFTADSLRECMKVFNEKQDEANTITNLDFCPKPTFLLPIPQSFKECGNHELGFISEAMEVTSGYTKMVLEKARAGRYEQTRLVQNEDPVLNKLRKDLNEANQRVFQKLKEHSLDNKKGRLNPREKLLVSTQKNEVKKAADDYKKYLSTLKGTRNEHLVKLNRFGKKGSTNFKLEMKHYSRSKSVFRGVGAMDEGMYEGFDNYIKGFIPNLLEPVDMPLIPLFNSERSPGPELLTELKNLYTERAQTFAEKYFIGKRIDGITTFVSKVAIHLFNESTKTYNGGYVKVDNLGLSGCLLLVKGGSKIYKHQTSRLYKLILKVKEDDCLWGGLLQNPNFKCVRKENYVLVSTPWSQMHQDILFDYMSIRERTFMNLFSAHTRICSDIESPPKQLTFLPLLLSLHNRRKTETFMHNSRYLIVNPLARYANLQGLMPSFAGFNYSYLDGWLRKRLELSYFSFASTLLKARGLKGARIDSVLSNGVIKDLWLDQPIENADQLTSFIYVTYMMTKAPVNSSMEQANNLWEILEDIKSYDEEHGDVEGLKDKSQRFSLLQSSDAVYEDDFTYDPVFCNYLGHHLAGQLSSQIGVAEMSNYWDQVKNQDISVIANSNGLRGWNKDNFFNKKGYEVIYSYIDSNLDKLIEEGDIFKKVEQYLAADPATAHQLINADKIKLDQLTGPDEIKLDSSAKALIFHIVHKLQRAGGREIFCMDIFTKSRQNPIEKLMKFICKKVPNEFISVPSNKRHGLIHSDFYERSVSKETKSIYRWVLDCRRWAPHSVFQKYVYFIEGLAPVLPSDFVLYFREFSELMMGKKFVTRDHVINKLEKNERYSKYKHIFRRSETIPKAWETKVKFSFVMGIFNYLSTLMHAANQMVASEVIRNQCIKRGLGLVIMDPKCHSDDSVVSSYHENPASIDFSLRIYDWLLKGANHMLSIKKSQVNENVYLEFLSVLYLFDRFLPVIPKFSSTIPFKPSDKGYSSDISFAITQSMEMLSQGGSYEESFIIMKLTERFIQKIYRINFIARLPHQMLGVIDSHPIELLYSGGMAELFRCMTYEPKMFWRAYKYLMNAKLVDQDQAELSLSWDMSARLSGNQREMLTKYKESMDKMPEKIEWTINNMKLGNGILNLIWYLNKLGDRSFFSSLVDEPVARKFARLFGSGVSRCLRANDAQLHSVTKTGLAMSRFIDEDDEYVEDVKLSNFLTFCCNDLAHFYKAIEGGKLSGGIETAGHKEKPIVFYQGLSILGNLEIGASDYVSYTREPDGYRLIGRRKNPVRDCSKITRQLELLGVDHESLSKDQLHAVVQKLVKDERRSFRLIMSMPGDERKIDSYASAVKSLSYNSLKWKTVGVTCRNAAVVDWQRKIVNGRIPESVSDFLQYYWFQDLTAKYGVNEKDIFKDDLPEISSLRDKVPSEWSPIVSSELNPDKILLDMPYWCCWTKEQVRVGSNWYGSGECYISIPEGLIKVEVVGGKMTKISLQTDYSGPLSIASSWYLNIFFNSTGLSADVTPREFGNPNTIYLGLDRDANFVIGRARASDSVYYDSCVESNITPLFCTEEMKYTKTGAKAVYYGLERDWVVNFFIPMEQPTTIDLSRYLDKDKLRNAASSDRAVNNFVQECASSVMGGGKKDINVLMRNIDGSLIYNIIHNFDRKYEVFTREATGQPLLESLLQWKKTHPGFGFPDEEQLKVLSKQGDVAPLAPKIMDMVKSLGLANINPQEFDLMISKLAVLPPEDRELYLLNLYPELGAGGQARSLAIVQKSTRIYNCCKFLVDRSHDLYCSFVDLISKSITDGNCHSDILSTLALQYSQNHSRRITQTEVFRIIAAQYLLDSCQSQYSYASQFSTAGMIFNSFRQLLESGIDSWLNINSMTDSIFRSVEFKVESEVLLGFLNDLMDNLSLFPGVLNTQELSYQYLAGEPRGNVKEGRYYKQWVRMKRELARLEYGTPKKEVLILLPPNKKGKKSKHLKLSLTNQTQPGFVHTKFKPLDEEWQEEYDISYSYETEFDDYEFDEDADIPKFAYVTIPVLTKESLRDVRGTAWNLIVSFHTLDENIRSIADNIEIFESMENRPKNIYSSVSPKLYLAQISPSKRKIAIPGHKKLSWETVNTLLTRAYMIDNTITIDDKKYEKKTVLQDSILCSKLETLDSYFKRISSTEMKKEVIQTQKAVEIAKANLLMSPNIEQEVKELDDLLSQAGLAKTKFLKTEEEIEEQEQEQKEDAGELLDDEGKEKKEDPFGFDLKGLLEAIMGKQNDFLDSLTNLGSGLFGIENFKTHDFNYRLKEPLDLLSDADLKSELEALFPGFWKPLMNKEISLSQRQKKDRLLLARAKIETYPSGWEKDSQTMLYQILLFILAEIPEHGGFAITSNSFLAHVDSLFIENDDQEEDRSLPDFYRLLPRPPMLLPESLDFL